MPRSPLDGEILRLAAPALGALAAEPLYLLVDTAIVGHLGTTQLAALALAASVLSTLTGLCIFLTYGTTAQVARLHGAGEERRAGQLAAQALWLALAIGIAIALVCLVLAGPLIDLLGGTGEAGSLAERYLRISALGLPLALVALAGQGHLRGVGDLRTPLVIVAAGPGRQRRARGGARLRAGLGAGRLGDRHGHRAGRDGRRVRRAAPARRRAGRRPAPGAGAHPPARPDLLGAVPALRALLSPS